MPRSAGYDNGLGAGGFTVLGALTALSPLTSIFILPALPDIAQDLDTSLSAAQFALSCSFAGLAIGLLIVGPLSDMLGRRGPLIGGILAYIATSVLCAIAPNVEVLIVARVLQGMCGGAIWVISRAIVRDVYPPWRSAKAFSQLAMITGLSPVIAPVIAGQMLLFTNWRGLLFALAALGVGAAILAMLFLRESLPQDRRSPDGFAANLKAMGGLIAKPYFFGFMAVGVVQSAMYFSFVIMSPFALEHDYDITPQAFSLFFSGVAVTIILGNQLNVFLLRRWGPHVLVMVYLLLCTFGASLFVGASFMNVSLPIALTTLYVFTITSGAANATITALGLAPYSRAAGSASALLGACQFGIGALLPPLVSFLGVTGITMGLTMLGTGVVALVIAQGVRRKNADEIHAAMYGDAKGL